MKKLFAMLLALVMTMGLMACGAKPETNNTDGDAAGGDAAVTEPANALEKIKADDGILVNLASSEMKRLFDWKRICREVRVVTPEFRIREDDRLKTVVVYTKMCRGEMTRHILKNRIGDPQQLKAFEWEGFRQDAALSKADDWLFTM